MNEQPQEAMDQAQSEQGLAEQEFDDELRTLLKRIFFNTADWMHTSEQQLLCNALKIDVRDVT